MRNKVIAAPVNEAIDTAVTADADVGLRCANPTYATEWKNTTLGEICSSQV